jgi:hypothetical protein
VAGRPKLAGGGTRAMVMSSSDGGEAWHWRYLAKGFPFMAAAGLQRSSKPAEYPTMATRGSTVVSL